jgi:hypothetical protein
MADGEATGGGFLAEFRRRKGPAWKRALQIAIEARRQRAAERSPSLRDQPSRDVKVARSRLEVSLEARLAVRSGVRLEDFLRHRLAKYAGRLPVPLEDLPVLIDIQDGEPVVRARPQAKVSTAAAYSPSLPRHDEAARWMKALVERDGPYAAQEIRDAEAAAAAHEARAVAARERLEQLSRALADDLAAGKVPAPAHIDATPEQLGRPPVSSPVPAAAVRIFVLALVAAEAWFFSAPVLEAQGIRQDALAAALRAAPLPGVLALVFSVGAAAAVFAFASVALERAAELLEAVPAPQRRKLLGVAGLLSAVLAAAVAAAATAPGGWAQRVLLFVVPFAAAVLLRVAARLSAARDTALAAALAWDRNLARDVAERARRSEVVDQMRAEVERCETERDEAQRRLRALEKRAVAADRLAAERARDQARRLDRLSESFAAALELDRYVFVRLASGAAHEALVRPRLRIEPARATERLGVAG